MQSSAVTPGTRLSEGGVNSYDPSEIFHPGSGSAGGLFLLNVSRFVPLSPPCCSRCKNTTQTVGILI